MTLEKLAILYDIKIPEDVLTLHNYFLNLKDLL